jgi:hypothetical protein
MDRTEAQEQRLTVLARYQEYVDALRACHLDSADPEVQTARRNLARAIEQACSEDPFLLSDFKRAFATRPHA